MFATRKISSIACIAFLVTSIASSTMSAADDTPAGKRSLGGSGEMIQLLMPHDTHLLAGIEVHGSRYGTSAPPQEKFLIYVLNEPMTKVVATEMAPYSSFERGEEKWVSIKFDQPIEFPEGGWIVLDFRAGRTKGVYVSYDNDADDIRSRIGLPGMEPKETGFAGNWMIRPLVDK